MKRGTFFILFVSVNVFFIFLQIHKKGKITEVSYQNQSKQHEIDMLKQQKDALTQQLQALKNPASVKEYATEQLNMKNVSLKQVHFSDAKAGA